MVDSNGQFALDIGAANIFNNYENNPYRRDQEMAKTLL
jgi:hypothetical protein